ncbi:MAG: hypothetical protein N2234_07025 [Planctomycetota bacterium]|nr:hypothetical protein [Planctomycetota bacterium]
MAYAYTPGLRVAKATRIVRHRLLPVDGEVLVKKGQKVRAEDVVARTEMPGDVESVNVVGKLGIEPQDIKRYMLKKEGDIVKKGEVIAESKPFIKWFKTTVVSPIDGVVESVSEVTGQVLVRHPPRPVQVQAYIDGVVEEVFPSQGVAVAAYGSFLQGIFGIGKECWGVLKCKAKSPSDVLDVKDLSEKDAGCVLVAGAFVSVEAILKAFELNVKGIVTGGLNASDIKRLLGRDIGVAITGTEEIPTTLVVTEGFGKMGMAQRTFSLLRERDGMRVSISGATQIRAGVIRPEVIIPLGDSVPQEVEQKEREALKVGDVVRLIREPYFGRIGAVSELPPELQKVETESKVRVLKVKLWDDGKEVLVPRANVELIEE